MLPYSNVQCLWKGFSPPPSPCHASHFSPSPQPPPLVQSQARAVEREEGLKDQLSSFREEATRQITELTAQLKQKVK